MKNKATKSILIIFAILFITASSQGVFAQEKVDWKEYETEHFIIRYIELDESTLSMVATEAENAYDKVTSDLRYQPDNKTIIQIGLNNKNLDWDWSGSYSIVENVIVLPSPMENKMNLLGKYRSTIKKVTPHEFTHHILSEGYQMRFPEWLGEGIATYEAEQKPERSSAYKKFKISISKDELLSLDKMGIFDLLEEDERSLAYIESYTVIEYIVDTYGHDKLVEILQAKRENKHMDQITDEVLGVSYEEFKSGWMNFVKEKYGQPLYELYLYDVFYLIGAAVLLRRGVRIWNQRKNN